MSWTPLRVNYTDAVWSGNKKYNMVENADNTVSFVDVTIYTNKENSFFGASDANAMNAAINVIMAMVENGTDLYTDFNAYFNTQKTAFQNRVNSEAEGFEDFIENLQTQAETDLDVIETGYETRMDNFENAQQALFTQWFNMVKGQLSTDVAGNLQNEITELDERLSNLEYMVLQNDLTVPIAVDNTGTVLLVDELGNAIVADWKY
jgi:hypothetical protein